MEGEVLRGFGSLPYTTLAVLMVGMSANTEMPHLFMLTILEKGSNTSHPLSLQRLRKRNVQPADGEMRCSRHAPLCVIATSFLLTTIEHVSRNTKV